MAGGGSLISCSIESILGRMPYNKALNRFTIFTAMCTLALIAAGGLVTSTGSGLAVPDWPLSYGQVMPPMVGGIFYEHGHRMIATFVGFLTLILAVWFWRKEPRIWVRNLAVGALGAVIAQGILGGLTVIFLLPTPISVSHATLAQTFFVIVSSLALFTSKWWLENQQVLSDGQGGAAISRLSVALVVAVYVQLILGALMRHTQSGLAIPDFPLAYGQLIPSLSSESLSEYNRLLLLNDYRIAADGPLGYGQVLVHFLHRGWALVVSALMIVASMRAYKLGKVFPRLKFFAAALPLLLVIQITLGALTVVSRKDVALTTAHVATGAALLVVSVLMTLHVFRYRNVSWKREPGIAGHREALA